MGAFPSSSSSQSGNSSDSARGSKTLPERIWDPENQIPQQNWLRCLAQCELLSAYVAQFYRSMCCWITTNNWNQAICHTYISPLLNDTHTNFRIPLLGDLQRIHDCISTLLFKHQHPIYVNYESVGRMSSFPPISNGSSPYSIWFRRISSLPSWFYYVVRYCSFSPAWFLHGTKPIPNHWEISRCWPKISHL